MRFFNRYNKHAAVRGKHVKTAAHAPKLGKHAASVDMSVPFDMSRIALGALLVVVVAVVPFTFNYAMVSLDAPLQMQASDVAQIDEQAQAQANDEIGSDRVNVGSKATKRSAQEDQAPSSEGQNQVDAASSQAVVPAAEGPAQSQPQQEAISQLDSQAQPQSEAQSQGQIQFDSSQQAQPQSDAPVQPQATADSATAQQQDQTATSSATESDEALMAQSTSSDATVSSQFLFTADASAAEQLEPASFTDNVKVKLQEPVMSAGCELISLDIVLDALGVDADIHTLVRDHLQIDGHFATGYSGDPYISGGGFPQGIVKAANSYLSELGQQITAYDLTGLEFEQLVPFVEKGYPLLVWTTMGFTAPYFEGVFDGGLEWFSNEHCVVVYGVEDGKVLISDPLEGLVTLDIQHFADIYHTCGKMAAILH